MINEVELIKFEAEIAELFLGKQIHAPIHLAGGNEQQLIALFKNIKPADWVVSTYRSHYHALLKGIPEVWLRTGILEGRSMHIMSKEYRFISSSIVAGGLPIALGLALSIKRMKGKNHVWSFVGDMASMGGTFHEVTHYATNFNLPITFVIEDNEYSVNTPTLQVWGKPQERHNIIKYTYKRRYPHAGAAQWVKF